MIWIRERELNALKERVSELEWQMTKQNNLDSIPLRDIMFRLLHHLNLNISHIYPGFTLVKKGGPEGPQVKVKGLYDT